MMLRRLYIKKWVIASTKTSRQVPCGVELATKNVMFIISAMRLDISEVCNMIITVDNIYKTFIRKYQKRCAMAGTQHGAISRHTLSQQVFLKISDLILENNLSGGDRLPTEMEFSETFGVSRTIIREALKALEIIGVVSTRPGQGTTVLYPSFIRVWRSLEQIMSGNERQFEDLWQTRMIIETKACKLASLRATDEDLQCIEHWLIRMEECILSKEYHGIASHNFHKAIVRAAKNKVLEALINMLSDLQADAIAFSYSHDGSARSECSLNQHKAIYHAIKSRNPQEASRLMQNHLQAIHTHTAS